MRFGIIVLCAMVAASCASTPTQSPFNLGVIAYQKQNYSEAAAQWTKEVARGNIKAMNNLGYLLYYGYGVAKDTTHAVALWRVAAEAGNSEAQWHLGRAYETGIGIEASLSKAYAWYRCAIENASRNSNSAGKDAGLETKILKDVTEAFERLRDRIGSDDLQRGQALATEYIARYGKPAP